MAKTLAETLQEKLQDKTYQDMVDYDLQVNYEEVKLEEAENIYLDSGDIVRLSKPFEDPIQFIVGEEG